MECVNDRIVVIEELVDAVVTAIGAGCQAINRDANCIARSDIATQVITAGRAHSISTDPTNMIFVCPGGGAVIAESDHTIEVVTRFENCARGW